MSAFKNIISNLKEIAKEVAYFVSSKIFVKNILMVAAIVGGVLALIFWWLGCYTHHGERITVPNVVGMSVQQASNLIEESNLEVIINDSIYVSGKKGGEIISQEPAGDSKAKRGRKIYVSVSAYLPKMETISWEYTQDIIEFRMHAKRKNMVLEEIPIQGDPTRPNEIQDIKVDGQLVYKNGKRLVETIKVRQGSKFEVTYINGAGEEVSIPDLMCQEYGEAIFNISSLELNYTVVADNSVVGDSSGAIVWKQDPESDDHYKIRKGESVTIFISKTQSCTGDGTNDNSGTTPTKPN